MAVFSNDTDRGVPGGVVRPVPLFVIGIVFLTEKEQNAVGVLFDRTGFTQVGQHRAVTLTLFGGAGELRKTDDRNVQFLGHDLESAGHLGDLLNAVFDPGRAGHQLKIVDDNQPEIFQPPHLRFHLRDRNTGGIVQPDMRSGKTLRRDGELAPLFLLQTPGAHLIRRDQRVGTEHTGDQLRIAHLERKNRDVHIGVLDPDVGGDIEGEGRLTHTGPGRHQNQVGAV